MVKLISIIEEIISETLKLQNLSIKEIIKDDNPPFPRLISTGNGGSILVSKKIDELIIRSADSFKQDSSLSLKYKDAEWNGLVRKAFGYALGNINVNDDISDSAEIIKTNIQDFLKEQVNSLGVREDIFGCTLFADTDFPVFEIGPVKFEPRLEWLQRKTKNGDVTKITSRRIEKQWQGSKQTKRKNNLEMIRERDILEVIGKCPYVCSVSTAKLSVDARLEKSAMAARLALTSISLFWKKPTNVLDGFNLSYDREVRIQKNLSFSPGKITLGGMKMIGMPHGPEIAREEWLGMLKDNADYFEVCGEILKYLLSGNDDQIDRPKMMNVLTHSLLWFHEGCRDEIALMAIVNFAASMDSLGGTSGKKGIFKVMENRLGWNKDKSINSHSTVTFKQMTDKIYGNGRSLMIHGKNNKF